MRYILFLLLLSCSAKKDQKWSYFTPIINSKNEFVGINRFYTNNVDSFQFKKSQLSNFDCELDPAIQVYDTLDKKTFISIAIPFTYKNQPIGLELRYNCIIDKKTREIDNSDGFLAGINYPNNVQESSTIFNYQNNIFSVVGNHKAGWAFANRILTNPELNFDYRKNERNVLRNSFFETKNSSGTLFANPENILMMLLVSEIRIDLKLKRISLKLFKNGKSILNIQNNLRTAALDSIKVQ